MVIRIRTDAAPAARKRQAFLSRQEIVEAAAVILQRDGYDALNMRALAAELGARAAALYRYVRGREELDDILFDHLMAGPPPDIGGADWREDLRTIASDWRARLIRKRDATRIALGQVSIGPNLLPLMEASLKTLSRSGLGEAEVIEAYQSITLFVHSFSHAEATYRAQQARPDGVPPQAPDTAAWRDDFPTVAAMVGRLGEPADFDQRFAFGLNALIAAIGALADRD